MNAPLSDLRLAEIEITLTQRDHDILNVLKKLRFLKTDQVRRLFFSNTAPTPRASLTAATRNLNRLKKHGIIDHLEKRVGGVRAGSLGLIWYLTEAGARLLNLGKDVKKRRINRPDPSFVFLRHILAVAECYIQINDICSRESRMRLSCLEVEPECWRAYDVKGQNLSLRPDLYAETISGEYTDYWFIEMDLDTEATQEIIAKCKRYLDYYQTGKEQSVKTVFPVILWIVPSAERKEKMEASIKEAFGNRQVRIFLIITPDELEGTLKEGADESKLC